MVFPKKSQRGLVGLRHFDGFAAFLQTHVFDQAEFLALTAFALFLRWPQVAELAELPEVRIMTLLFSLECCLGFPRSPH